MPHRFVRLAIAIIGLPVALRWLQPWKLFVRITADERLPQGARSTHCGDFGGRIHPTSGVARLVTLADGAQILRLENLHTTLGPRLRVWLSEAPVDDVRFPWRRIARSTHVDLGRLRANRGNADLRRAQWHRHRHAQQRDPLVRALQCALRRGPIAPPDPIIYPIARRACLFRASCGTGAMIHPGRSSGDSLEACGTQCIRGGDRSLSIITRVNPAGE